MHILTFSENITCLRRERGMTQEQLADFLGVTKASVSKWETKQSLPDILMLPKLAAFFDVTIDQLLGYEPQLSKEQIQRIYEELAEAFARREDFEQIMCRSGEMVKQYYNCYLFLFYIGSLWLNHFMLAENKERQTEILEDAIALFDHIICQCREMSLCSDALLMRATALLQLERAEDVIETLEETLNPYRLAVQSDSLLIQAYQMVGKTDEADSFAQVSMYIHLIVLMSDAIYRMSLRQNDRAICLETIRRMDNLLENWNKEMMHPSEAVYHIQAAVIYMHHSMREEALDRLERYVKCIGDCEEKEFRLCGDSYFDKLGDWIDDLMQKGRAPRSKEVILESAMQIFEHPVFEPVRKDPRFLAIKRLLEAKGGDKR
ncbi:helix-turn-helix domain-containing protein [Ihubacter sp. rT4E-8]|uniref:helix-turn-helix domain-containing protein n=1 Tax=Ihubacter sp. rT4E-8 TaxID=3242369 RepID=UPI003CEC9DB1